MGCRRVEAYRHALAPLGVEAVVVEPGGFPTEVLSKATPPADAARIATYGATAGMIGGLFAAMQQMLASPHALDLPAGTRPARTVVDPNPQAVEGLNAAAAQVQGGLLGMLGLGAMLTAATRQASS